MVTGLIHISVLLLPQIGSLEGESAHHPHQQHHSAGTQRSSTTTNTTNTANKSKQRAGGSANKRKPTFSTTTAAAPTAQITNSVVATGAVADGSDYRAWEQVNTALEQQSASHLDWGNTCIYNLHDDGIFRVAAVPNYPLPATAAFHAAQEHKEGHRGGGGGSIICNDHQSKYVI